ncbi:MAG: hypothetical protein GW903_00175 [Alphaproteobacteria bacterium]|nr:hypothetical protein [Alphaproteobacteria bacterium]NCQ87386.1 hypothetical protein [Alphaproteobacteria bacterium]NCT06257.1 hypothetical protein [Alphaproteobacteria bacterium]
MSNLIILNIQILSAICIYLLIYRVYLRDWFNTRDFRAAVLPLLILHSFRYLGLSLIVTGQIASEVPRGALQIMAWGDFAAGFAALLAAITIASKSKRGPFMVLLFSVIGIADLMVVGPTAYNAGVFDADIGTMWFILVTLAPALLLTHVYIVYRLFKYFKSCSKNELGKT